MASEVKGATVRPRRKPRWWPAISILVLAAVSILAIRLAVVDNHQTRFMLTTLVVILSLLGLVGWLLVLSRIRWSRRLAGVGGLLVVLVGAGQLLRIDGVTGNLVPILRWRWSAPAGGTAGGGANLDPTSLEGATFPGFWGADRDGRVAGVRLDPDWSTSPPVLLWRRPVGTGWSGFAVHSGVAVTLEGTDDGEAVVARRLSDGETLWRVDSPASHVDPLGGPGPRSTPSIDGGAVYTLGSTGRLSAIELDSGRERWSVDVLADTRASVPGYGVSASPWVDETSVVVPAGGPSDRSLVAYDRETGTRLWGAGSAPAAYSSPQPARLHGRDLRLIFNTEGLFAHDALDGEIVWRTPWKGESQHVSQPLVLPGDRVFLSSGYGVGGTLFQTSPAAVPEVVWESRSLKAKFTNVVHRQGVLYGLDDGILVAVDAETGDRHWKRGRYGHGQLLLVGDLLVIQAESGDVALVDARPDEFVERARLAALTGKTWNHPTLAGPFLVVRNDREAAAFRLPTL